MSTLFTGATGFVGRAVLKELVKTGREITATSRTVRSSTVDEFKGVNWVALDLNDDPSGCFERLGKPDSIIHLAWEGLPHYRELYHIERNLWTSYCFLRSMIESGVSDLTVVGTCLEYGLANGCLSESLTPKPTVPYAIAKDTLRRFLEALIRGRNISFKWIRLFYLYGDGQNPSSLFEQLRRAIANGDAIFPMTSGEQLRDYLPVEIAASYISEIACQRDHLGVINCCSGQPVSVRRLVEEAIKTGGSQLKPLFGSLPYADYEPIAFWGDNTRLTEILSEDFNDEQK